MSPRPRGPLRRDLRLIVTEGAAFSLMQGMGENFIPAFALALGMRDVVAGLVAAVPQLTGAVLQLAAPAVVRHLKSYRRGTVFLVAVQAMSFVPLAVSAVVGRISPVALFFVVSFYWAGGIGAGPVWNTWMGTVIPPEIRAKFLAQRGRVCQAMTLVGLTLAGWIVDYGNSANRVLGAFAAIFALAALFRSFSAALLYSQSEPIPIIAGHRDVSVREAFAKLRRGSDGRMLGFFLLMQVMVQTAHPYFNPYMLDALKLPYRQFTILVAAMFLAKALAMPRLGVIAHHDGTRRLLWFGALGTAVLPALWLVSGSFGYLVVVQLASGLAWAAWELAVTLVFFEAIKDNERTSLLTLFNVANAAAVFVGAYLGKLILDGVTSAASGHGAYMVLFASSFAARMLMLPFLRTVPGKAARAAPVNVDRTVRQPAGRDTRVVETTPRR